MPNPFKKLSLNTHVYDGKVTQHSHISDVDFCFAGAAVQAAPLAAETAPKKGSIQKWENGFQIERLAMGRPDGKLAKPGKKVVVKYRGTLANGKMFDESKKPFSFRLGGAFAKAVRV